MTIDRIENYPGREDTSGFELAEEMEKQARSFGVRIEYLQALSFSKEGEGRFTANTPDGPIKAKAIILAMGAGHRHLDVPGEAEYEGHGVSYCATCDGPFFRGKDIVVVGGGDTALTDAAYLAKICRKVRLVHRRVAFRAQKARRASVMGAEPGFRMAAERGDPRAMCLLGELISDGKVEPRDGKDADFWFVRAEKALALSGNDGNGFVSRGELDIETGEIRTS